MKTTTRWIEALAFEATADTGHTVRIDTSVEGGGLGSGMNPKRMVLGALSACSGMDVVEMLKKMRVPFTKLEIEAEAEQTKDHPKVYTFINLIYTVDARPEDLAKVTKAVTLSKDKYCGVSAMLAKHCEIHFRIELV